MDCPFKASPRKNVSNQESAEQHNATTNRVKGQLVKSLKWMCFLEGAIRCGGKCTEKSSIGDSVLFDPSNGGHLMKRCCCALFDPAECLTPEYEVR